MTLRGLVLSAVLFVVPTLAAQQPSDSAPPAEVSNPHCWRGRPLPHCRAFLLFEFSAPRFLTGTKLDMSVAQQGNGYSRYEQGLVSQFVFDLGAMRNISDRDAVGGTVMVGMIVDNPGREFVTGATARYRRWLTPVVSADAAAGVAAMPVGVEVQQPFGLTRQSVIRPALVADARLGLGDLVAVTGRAMVANDGRGRTHSALFAGASVGSTTTAVLTTVYAVLIMGTLILIGSGHGD
jgi:hypothetical protein